MRVVWISEALNVCRLQVHLLTYKSQLADNRIRAVDGSMKFFRLFCLQFFYSKYYKKKYFDQVYFLLFLASHFSSLKLKTFPFRSFTQWCKPMDYGEEEIKTNLAQHNSAPEVTTHQHNIDTLIVKLTHSFLHLYQNRINFMALWTQDLNGKGFLNRHCIAHE